MNNKPNYNSGDIVEFVSEYKLKMEEYANDKFVVKDIFLGFGESYWLVTFHNLFEDFHYPAHFFQKINE